MNFEKLKKHKNELESEINRLIREFQEEYEVNVYVDRNFDRTEIGKSYDLYNVSVKVEI